MKIDGIADIGSAAMLSAVYWAFGKEWAAVYFWANLVISFAVGLSEWNEMAGWR